MHVSPTASSVRLSPLCQTCNAHNPTYRPFRLEQFYYLNYKAFPPIINATGNQCFSFMNQAKGGFCSLNSCIFPTYSGWTKHGSSESEGCTRGGMHRSGV